MDFNLKEMLDSFEKKELHCGTHGSYIGSVNKVTQYVEVCPQCQKAQEQERWHQERIAHRINISGLPKRHFEKELSDYEVKNRSQQTAKEATEKYINEFCANPSRSLIMIGGVGTGKTHLASAIIKGIIRGGYSGLYTTINDMFYKVRSTFNNSQSGQNADTILETLTSFDLLVIDEAGMSELSKFEDNFLYQVINGRYEQEKATVIISNQPINDLKDNLGDRVVDRLREDGGQLIDMQHGSYRR